MKDRRHLLKIKLKSLAAEARIIRNAERKLALPRSVQVENGAPVIPARYTKDQRDANPEAVKQHAKTIRSLVRMRRAELRGKPWYDANRAELAGMQDHRKKPLRRAARATHLAYGFLRGRTYQQIEGARQLPNDSIYERQHEERLFEEAAKMAAAYSGSALKAEFMNHFNEWVLRKDARLAYSDDGKTAGLIALSPPTTEFGTLIS